MRLNVTVPANARAAVTLPGAALGQVVESGVLLVEAEGVSNPVQRGADVQIAVGSGVYDFEYPVG